MNTFEPEIPNEAIKPGPIAWMASHPVAANLLMLILLLGGAFIYSQTTKEVFPTFTLDSISVQMGYPGASPSEVEQGIVLAIEDAMRDVEGLDEITSKANEGSATVSAEILDTGETMRVLQDVKTAIDSISTFPVDAEELTVQLNSRRRGVIELALYGDLGEQALRNAADILRKKLESNSGIGPVELVGVKDREIHIEISQANLRRYNLTLQQVTSSIQSIALELGGGSLKTSVGEILVRMSERRDNAIDFHDIPILSLTNGSQILLGDIATISEGFEDVNNSASFNGKPAIMLEIYRIGDQTPSSVAKAVYSELDQIGTLLPAQLQVGVVDDDSILFEQRAELLIKNGLTGLLLVVIFLALFLDVRLAFWVSMGIPISFMGAFLLFPATDFTVNIISMFAFIISLGIVVDDAVVSGENIYHYRQKGYNPLQAAVAGAREIATPITVSVITNMVAFLPLLFVPGQMGKVFGIIPIVVMAAFFVSLIESLFVLPAHLTFKKVDKESTGLLGKISRWQKDFNRKFEHFVKNHYGAFLQLVMRQRYVTLAIFSAILIIVGSYALSGRMGMTLFPRVESDYAFASATLKVGAPDSEVFSVQKRLVDNAQKVIDDNGGDTLSTGIFSEVKQNVVEVRAFLTESDIRPITTADFSSKWRQNTGDISGLETLSFTSNRGGPGSGAALTVELSHSDTEILDEAAQMLAAAIAEFDITKDIDDGAAQGKRQYEFVMKDLGYTLGLTTADVGRQVRAAFYGSEAFKQQRGSDEVRVLVRWPDAERTSEYYLKNMILKTPSGGEVLLRDAVEMRDGRAYTTISRRAGQRVINVTADVDPPSQSNRVVGAIQQTTLPELQQRYLGLSYSFEGKQAEIRESVSSLLWGLFAVLFVMYALLAVLFSSYTQPLMILLAIPFSAVGAVLGHQLMGYSLSVMSLFGMMALAGVVVNDSLILIEFANRKRGDGSLLHDSVFNASLQRFRPILLTTLTTFVGLAPMMFETSRQARFLIPMAISLGFGILVATFVTLVLIPALFMIIEDIKTVWRKAKAALSFQV